MSEIVTQAAYDVLAERQRQVEAEGWSPEHDDEHDAGELADAAACYAGNYHLRYSMSSTAPAAPVPSLWPWAREWWNPQGARRDLVKAAALILAEIERIDRAAGCCIDEGCPHAGTAHVCIEGPKS